MRLLKYSLAIIIGAIEYLPIPNMPNLIIEVVQAMSFWTPFIAMFYIIRWLRKEKNKLAFVPFLLFSIFIVFFPMRIRNLVNNYIIYTNSNNSMKEMINPVAGTKMQKHDRSVSFSWRVFPFENEELVFHPSHGLKSIIDREITDVVNKDWYVSRTNPLD